LSFLFIIIILHISLVQSCYKEFVNNNKLKYEKPNILYYTCLQSFLCDVSFCLFSYLAVTFSLHDDTSDKLCDNCTMIIVNYADLWLVHSHVASLLDGVRLELRELKACSTLLGACTICPLLRSDLKFSAVEIKDLKHKLDHSSRYSVLSPLRDACDSLKGKLFHAIKENTKLQQEVAYLTTRLQKTALSEKMI
jgi:hypothetical protein